MRRDSRAGDGEVRPLISLCMATCLRADLFPESLEGLMRQTYPALEIVVLVDGADERSLRVLEACGDPRVRWITTPSPSGMVPAWNRVVRESCGKYFLFCADDDVLLPNAIDAQVELLERCPKVAFCHADFAFIDDDGRELGRWTSHEGTFVRPGAAEWARYVVRTGCCMQTTVVRRRSWDEVDGWDEDAGNPGDNSLYLKLLRIGDVGHVGVLACRYRLRTHNPDSWDKRFRDVREFHALSVRHLSAPPPDCPSVAPVRRRFGASLARRTVPLLLSAPSETARQQLRAWLTAEVWPLSMYGRAVALSETMGATGLLATAVRGEAYARGLARRAVRRVRGR